MKRAISPALVEQFHFASSVPATDGGTPLGTAALHELSTVWPRALSFSELATKAACAGLPADRNTMTALSTFLLNCYASTRALEFQLWPPVFQPTVSAYPATTALARWQATRGARAANARHETVILGPEERELLAKLDGTRSRAALTAESPAAAEILPQFAGAALLAG